jgi:UDP-glucuronate decarboxylase
MNIIVTGCAGHLGSLLSKKLLDEGHQVFGIDNFSTGFKSNLPSSKKFLFFQGDVNGNALRNNLPQKITYHAIYHFAACVGVQRTILNPSLVFEDLVGLKNVIDFVILNRVNHLFFSSSSEVYGEPVSLPLNEKSTPLNVRLPYAAVKSMGELLITEYSQMFEFRFTIFRFFNTYSEFQSNDFVVPIFVKKAIANEDLVIFGDGSQTRSFLYAQDNINFCYQCLNDERAYNITVNVGSEKEVTIEELANIVIKTVNSKSRIIKVPPLEKGDMTRRQPDNKIFLQLYGKNLVSLEEGIKKFI